MEHEPNPPRSRSGLLIAAVTALVAFALLVANRPDRRRQSIVPGTSSRPTFFVQVIRPRAGLPLGGLLPPGLFGLDARLGFDSTDPSATVDTANPMKLELSAEGWTVRVLADEQGRALAGTEAVFEIVFEDEPRRVRCRPALETVGSLWTVDPGRGGTEISGRFEVELARCEDAATGEPLGWPPSPLVLHGSFDRLEVTER